MLVSKATRGWSLAAIVALTGLALALRLHRILFQSLWWDEGISLYLAGLDLAHLTTAKDFAIDLHPPLYHVLLGGWRTLAGSSVFAMRFFSAALGVLAVPVVFVIGRRLAGPAAGLIAAGIVATSPFAIFSGQEIRMYTLLPLLGVVSVAICQRLLDEIEADPSRQAGHKAGASVPAWVALVVVNVLGLYSYYYFGLLILAEDLAILVALIASRPARPTLVAWVASQAASAVLFIPWAIPLVGIFRSGVANAIPIDAEVHRTLGAYLRECLVAFVAGFSPPARLTTIALVAVVALGALGIFANRRHRSTWLLVFGVAVPLAGAYAILLGRPFFYPRFINYCAPLLDVLFGAGIVALVGAGRRLGRLAGAGALAVGVGALGVVLAAAGGSLAVQYREPRVAYSTADYRVTLADLATLAEPGDVVIGTYPWQLGYVAGYLPNAGLALIAPQSGDATAAGAARIVAAHPRVWLLLYAAGGKWQADRFEDALAGAARPVYDSRFGDSRVRLFAAGQPAPAVNPAARLGDRIALVSYQLGQSSLGSSRPLRPGESVELTLTWQATAPVAESYTEFVHLVGPDGRVVAQEDAPPLAGARPTDGWAVGETIVDRHRLRLPADAPAGEYLAEVGLYRPQNGERLSVGRSTEEVDRVIVGRFEVVR